MKFNNIPFLDNDFYLNSSLVPKANKSLSPFVYLSVNKSDLNIFISFYPLTKKDIFIDYTHNFLVLKVFFSTNYSKEIFNLKRIFYYKNLDFYKYMYKQMNDVVFLKIPFIS